MSKGSLVVTGAGMATALGGVLEGCAAARAGMNRVRPLAYAVEDRASFEAVPVSGHPAGLWTLGFAEIGLATRLLSLALDDLIARSPAPIDFATTAVVVNFASDYYLRCVDERSAAAAGAGGEPTQEARKFALGRKLYEPVIEKAYRVLGIDAPSRGLQKLLFADQAGLGDALTAAGELLALPDVTGCLVACVDSLLEPRWLRALDGLGVLKTAVRPVGAAPGEAGAVLLIERGNPRPKRRVLGTISQLAQARETAHRFADERPLGRALADVIRACAAEPGPFALISDLNGDDARAVDLGAAFVHLDPSVHPVTTLVPAISFGDTRAAAGALGICVALHGIARGYAPAGGYVVSMANDEGGRAALRVTAAR